ncbi:uncharacterized protein LOC119405846 [Rhipicephalus sanguineus]|uniref:uncharacterized protein LOC119405846 n=1 Tax=Rhipicephalus sanguineus TaxID=34632 RepID=UPI001894328B|nr:uncharacterized protein LOC119405846 [Rhipicephalus sanguineus]
MEAALKNLLETMERLDLASAAFCAARGDAASAAYLAARCAAVPTVGYAAAGADEDAGCGAEQAGTVGSKENDSDANVDEVDRATATGGSTSAETSTPTTAADVAWDADSNADGGQGPAAGQEPAIPAIRGSTLAQNEETLEHWLTANVEGASTSKGVSGDRDDVGAGVPAQVLDDVEFVDKRTGVCSGEAEECAECLEEKAVEGEQEEEGDKDYLENDRVVEAESLADALEGEAMDVLWEEAASDARELSTEGDEVAGPQRRGASVEAKNGTAEGAVATGKNDEGSDESDDDHSQLDRNRDNHARSHENHGQGRQDIRHQSKGSCCKGGQGKAAVRAPAKALGNAPEKAVPTETQTTVVKGHKDKNRRRLSSRTFTFEAGNVWGSRITILALAFSGGDGKQRRAPLRMCLHAGMLYKPAQRAALGEWPANCRELRGCARRAVHWGQG